MVGVGEAVGVGGSGSGRRTSPHVVLHAAALERVRVLAPPLEEADEANDLELRVRGQRIPLRERRAGRGDVGVGDVARELPREARVRLHAEADEGRHRDAAVLDLRLTQESDRRLLRLVPELHLCEAGGVVVADRRVQLASQDLEVLNLHAHKVWKSGHSSCGRLGSSHPCSFSTRAASSVPVLAVVSLVSLRLLWSGFASRAIG